MIYYSKAKFFLGNPLWRIYLRRIYKTSIQDFAKLRFTPNFKGPNFTCLLCGVGNEATADEFIRFVLSRNKLAAIWIIDLGKEQVQAVQDMVKAKYHSQNIQVHQLNALNIGQLFKPKTIDWIETDGLFEFFDNKTLVRLLSEWSRILKPTGFATTRATSTANIFDILVDKFKIWVGDKIVKVKVYTHTRKEMHDNFTKAKLSVVEGPTFVPYFKRYSLVKYNKENP